MVGSEKKSVGKHFGTIAVVLSALFSTSAQATCPTFHTLTNGTTADASQVMDNFNSILQCPNFTGKVGVGTANPTFSLDVIGNQHLYSAFPLALIENSSSTSYGSIRIYNDASSNVRALEIDYSGTAYPSNLAYSGPTGESGSITTTGAYPLALGTSNTARLVINSSGSIRFVAYGAGTLTTDSAGNVTASSDARLKRIDGSFGRGLSAVRSLNPILYHWNELSGFDQQTLYAGFSAQNVQSVIPEAVGQTHDGYLTISDRPVIAASVNAIKELAVQIDELRKENAALRGQLAELATEIRDVDKRPLRASVQDQKRQ